MPGGPACYTLSQAPEDPASEEFDEMHAGADHTDIPDISAGGG